MILRNSIPDVCCLGCTDIKLRYIGIGGIVDDTKSVVAGSGHGGGRGFSSLWVEASGKTHLVYRSSPPWLLHSHKLNRSFLCPLALGFWKRMSDSAVEWDKAWTSLLDTSPKLESHKLY